MSRWIDADAIKIPSTSVDMFENCRNCTLLDEFQVREIIDSAPSIDIVRCKECKRANHELSGVYCGISDVLMGEDGFCSIGEREGE